MGKNRRKPPADHVEYRTLEDLLASLDQEDLEDLAEVYEVTDEDEKTNKNELAKIIAAYLLDEKNFESMFLTLVDPEIETFEKVIASGEATYAPRTEEEIDGLYNLDDLIDRGYIELQEDGWIDIPGDVAAAYRKLSSKAFHEKRHKMLWLLACFSIAGALYGVVPIKILVQLFNQSSKHHLNYRELKELAALIPEDMRNFTLIGKEYVYNDYLVLEDNPEDVLSYEELKAAQGDIPFYIPDESEITMFAMLGILPQESTDAYYHYLQGTNIAVEDVLFALTNIQELLRHGVRVEDLIQEQGEAVRLMIGPSRKTFRKLFAAMENEARLLQMRGHTLAEALALPDDDDDDNIIPFPDRDM